MVEHVILEPQKK